MKTTILLILFISCTIRAYYCPDTSIDALEQETCGPPESKCETKIGAVGICAKIYDQLYSRCCPNITHPDDFQSNMACDESKKLSDKLVYCKNRYVFHVGVTHFKANTQSSIPCDYNSNCTKGSYCVDYVGKRCYVIDPPEKKEEDNTLLIIIIVAIVVFLVAIIGIAVGFFMWRKAKKGKGQKSSTENGQSGKKGKLKKGSKA